MSLASTTLNNLPSELLMNIAYLLPARDLAAYGSTCRATRACSLDDRMWERHYENDAGKQAYVAAKRTKPWDRLWRAMYGEIYPTIRHPTLTPPEYARPGDYVTAKRDYTRSPWEPHRKHLVSEVMAVSPKSLRVRHTKPAWIGPQVTDVSKSSLFDGISPDMVRIMSNHVREGASIPFGGTITVAYTCTGFAPDTQFTVLGHTRGNWGVSYYVENPEHPLTPQDWVCVTKAQERREEMRKTPWWSGRAFDREPQ